MTKVRLVMSSIIPGLLKPVLVLSVIYGLTNRRIGIRVHLNQIFFSLSHEVHCCNARENSHVRAVVGDDSDLIRGDLEIYPRVHRERMILLDDGGFNAKAAC